MPPRLKGPSSPDETAQARELTELVTLFDRAGVEGAFVPTFVQALNPSNDDPSFDFDAGEVQPRAQLRQPRGRAREGVPDVPWDARPYGTTYPDMRWGPNGFGRPVPPRIPSVRDVAVGLGDMRS